MMNRQHENDHYSIEAQKQAIREAVSLRGWPEPIFFYEDNDEQNAREEQTAHNSIISNEQKQEGSTNV